MLSDKNSTAAVVATSNTPPAPGTGRSQLAPTTPEFAQLEYGLQLTLRASTTRIVAAFAVSNPHLSLQFERRAKDTLTLPLWLDAAYFGGINTEEDVVRRGFRFPPPHQGLRFVVGRIEGVVESPDHDTPIEADTQQHQQGSEATQPPAPSPSASNPPSPTKQQVPHQQTHAHRSLRKAVVCQLAVGRALVTDEAAAERENLPEGYDSFIIQDPTAITETQAQPYETTYYIKNPAQILPMYIVHYEYDSSREKQSRERAHCDNCEVDIAMVHCAADAANLCGKCDGLLHQSKLASRHVRTPIGKGVDVFGFCRHHTDKAIEFFCSQCHVPVCVFCKMVGHHANGEAVRHQLVSVTEAYQSALQEAQMPDPILQARRSEIGNQISAVNSRARAVEKMGSQIEQQIEEMYQRAMQDLRSIIQSKLTVLLGDELELKRQLSEIDRLEDFLKYQQTGDATTFLFNWSRHQLFRADLHDFRFFRNVIDVQLDAKVTGGIAVVVDDDGRHSHANMVGAKNTSAGVSVTATALTPTNAITTLPLSSSPPVDRMAIGSTVNSNTINNNTSHMMQSNPNAVMSMQHLSIGQAGTMSRLNLGRSGPMQVNSAGNGGLSGLAHSQMNMSMPRLNTGPIGLGIPNKMAQHAQGQQSRRIQRRTSDFFAEALGSFDASGAGYAGGMGGVSTGLPCDDDDMDHISNSHRYD